VGREYLRREAVATFRVCRVFFFFSMLSIPFKSRIENMDIVRIGHPRRDSDDAANNDNDDKAATPSIFVVPVTANYQASGFVHTVVTRCGNSRYTLAFQLDGNETVALIAQKLSKSKIRTSNYHLFDATRAGGDVKLTKKSGHYIGKLSREKGLGYTLYDSSREKEQLAAFVYEHPPALVAQIKEGQPPRKMQAVIPKYSSHNNKQGKGSKIVEEKTVNVTHHNNRLLEHLHAGTWKHHALVAVQTRPPTFQQGQFRLNFNGRGEFHIINLFSLTLN